MIIFPVAPAHIEIPSDFAVALTGATDAKGVPVDITVLPFYFEFYTALCAQKYVCSFDGTQRVNCKVVDKTVHLIFEQYPWTSSAKILYREREQFPDPDFSDGVKEVWSSGDTNIYLQK